MTHCAGRSVDEIQASRSERDDSAVRQETRSQMDSECLKVVAGRAKFAAICGLFAQAAQQFGHYVHRRRVESNL
jgi:hypothetical protein